LVTVHRLQRQNGYVLPLPRPLRGTSLRRGLAIRMQAYPPIPVMI
jgi:hypothetical protein